MKLTFSFKKRFALAVIVMILLDNTLNATRTVAGTTRERPATTQSSSFATSPSMHWPRHLLSQSPATTPEQSSPPHAQWTSGAGVRQTATVTPAAVSRGGSLQEGRDTAWSLESVSQEGGSQDTSDKVEDHLTSPASRHVSDPSVPGKDESFALGQSQTDSGSLATVPPGNGTTAQHEKNDTESTHEMSDIESNDESLFRSESRVKVPFALASAVDDTFEYKTQALSGSTADTSTAETLPDTHSMPQISIVAGSTPGTMSDTESSSKTSQDSESDVGSFTSRNIESRSSQVENGPEHEQEETWSGHSDGHSNPNFLPATSPPSPKLGFLTGLLSSFNITGSLLNLLNGTLGNRSNTDNGPKKNHTRNILDTNRSLGGRQSVGDDEGFPRNGTNKDTRLVDVAKSNATTTSASVTTSNTAVTITEDSKPARQDVVEQDEHINGRQAGSTDAETKDRITKGRDVADPVTTVTTDEKQVGFLDFSTENLTACLQLGRIWVIEASRGRIYINSSHLQNGTSPVGSKACEVDIVPPAGHVVQLQPVLLHNMCHQAFMHVYDRSKMFPVRKLLDHCSHRQMR